MPEMKSLTVCWPPMASRGADEPCARQHGDEVDLHDVQYDDARGEPGDQRDHVEHHLARRIDALSPPLLGQFGGLAEQARHPHAPERRRMVEAPVGDPPHEPSQHAPGEAGEDPCGEEHTDGGGRPGEEDVEGLVRRDGLVSRHAGRPGGRVRADGADACRRCRRCRKLAAALATATMFTRSGCHRVRRTGRRCDGCHPGGAPEWRSAGRFEQHERDLPFGALLISAVVLVVGDDLRPHPGSFLRRGHSGRHRLLRRPFQGHLDVRIVTQVEEPRRMLVVATRATPR